MVPVCEPLNLIGAAVRLALGGTLVLSGVLKWQHRSQPAALLNALGMSSSPLLTIGVALLSIVEILLGLWLMLGQQPVAALGITLLLLTGFTVALLAAIHRGYQGQCACFGTIDRHRVGPMHFVRNGVLIIASAFAGWRALGHDCAAVPPWELSPAVLATAVVLLAVAVAMYALVIEATDFYRRTII